MPEGALDSACSGASQNKRCGTQTRRRGTRLHWINGRGHLALEGLTAPATKNTRSNPLPVPFSELSFRLGQCDLSKIDMRKDLVRFVITVA
jgi:hypothetical protein